jgi:hypothetical protein
MEYGLVSKNKGWLGWFVTALTDTAESTEDGQFTTKTTKSRLKTPGPLEFGKERSTDATGDAGAVDRVRLSEPGRL